MNSALFASEHAALDLLATKYTTLTGKIKDANDTLANAIKTRDDYNKTVTDQYSNLPSATGDVKVADYIKNLQKQVEDTKVFANTLQRLHQLGLNDEMYKDLVTTGTSALPFVEELLSQGKTGIDQINKLKNDLTAAGAGIGKTASSDLYQAAVDSAAGLVKGLENQQAAIQRQMDKIADAMVNSIKKKLGIKSPSRVFKALGNYSAQGLIDGLGEMSSSVEKVASDTGNAATEALRKSLSGFSDLITTDVELNPTITPVLDLSGVKKDASQIGSLLPSQTVSVDAAYAKANAISTERMSMQEDVTTGTPAVRNAVTFTQNNYSPKALSSAEIYRQTNNQISKAKGALT